MLSWPGRDGPFLWDGREQNLEQSCASEVSLKWISGLRPSSLRKLSKDESKKREKAVCVSETDKEGEEPTINIPLFRMDVVRRFCARRGVFAFPFILHTFCSFSCGVLTVITVIISRASVARKWSSGDGRISVPPFGAWAVSPSGPLSETLYLCVSALSCVKWGEGHCRPSRAAGEGGVSYSLGHTCPCPGTEPAQRMPVRLKWPFLAGLCKQYPPHAPSPVPILSLWISGALTTP